MLYIIPFQMHGRLITKISPTTEKSVGIAVVIGIFLFIKCDSVMGRFYCNSSLYYQNILKHFRNCC